MPELNYSLKKNHGREELLLNTANNKQNRRSMR